MDRVNNAKRILWIILGIAIAVGITRFIYGLGATTNLTDNAPWGFWIGFDVMGGVALAGGGFVIAAFNYIFKIKEFHAVSRAAILTAFLGYIAVAVGLLFDLGLPWNIWHMIIYWNPHSPLFEVGWCVMLYLTVLFLEFAPVILERWPQINFLRGIYNLLNKFKIPIVILGIMLSTLHQSSLGSLFLAMPYKLHPLWYSPIIPIIFFISAICLGLMMVMTESTISSYLYRKPPEKGILRRLGKAAVWMLLIYASVKFGDILVRGAGPLMFEASWATFLFWMEIAVSIAIPLTIFAIPALRRNTGWLFAGAATGVVGVVFNRLNVGGLTHLNNLTNLGEFYFPSWTELAISAGVVSGAALVFFYFIENYKVWDEMPVDPDEDPRAKPKFDTNRVYFGPTKPANRTKFSFAFVIAFGLGFAFLSGDKIHSKGYEDIEATGARGRDTLFVDGNKDGYGVEFKHEYHTAALTIACATCHHMNSPGDQNTSCYECHYNMYTAGDAFKHDWHASSDGADLKCFDCHATGEFKSAQTAAGCETCHLDLFPVNTGVKVEKYTTPSYVDAMHMMCIDCHTKSMKDSVGLAMRKPDLDKCSTCHPKGVEHKYTKKLFEERGPNKWVVLPTKIRRD